MRNIDAHREDHPAADRTGTTGVSVHEVHHQVCAARLQHCPSGRAGTALGGRRRHHRSVSQYRPTSHGGPAEGFPDTVPPSDTQRRQPALTVLALTVAMGVVYLGTIWLLDPGINDRVLLLGGFLIATGGAVVLNAITVEATNRSAGNRL